jgi:hypothetical protein
VPRAPDRQLRAEWLLRSAPFRLVAAEDCVLGTNGAVQISVARTKEWAANGVTHCVIDRDGHHWICYTRENNDQSQQEVENLNTEAAFAAMAHGTQAAKLLK